MTDFLLFVVLVAAFMIGVLRGSVRQLLALGGWVVTFILAAHVRGPITEAVLGQFSGVTEEYAQMVAFVLAFLVLFGIVLLVIQTTGIKVQLTMRPYVDELIGGILMLLVAVLALASLILALDSYYAGAVPGQPEIGVVKQMHDALQVSGIARFLRESVNPTLLSLLSPLLPADVRAPG